MWKKFSIKDCINKIEWEQSELKTSTLNDCWKAVLPECIRNKDEIIEVGFEIPDFKEHSDKNEDYPVLNTY